VQVEFNASERSSLGVEVELQLVDVETRELVGAAPGVLEELSARHGVEEHPRIKAELYQCTLEVITGICDTVEDARRDLEEGIAEIRGIIEPRGVDLVSSGLHPFTPWQSQERSVGERYDAIVERIQWPAKRLITHGVHYHVGIRSAEKSIQITNALATMLPVFLALSTSSPFWHGDDTGLESARTKVFESLPSTGLPPNLADWAEFERFMTSLISAGAMTTIREVWWDIRPHPNFGTVELRMCDAMPTMSETCALAALAQCAVARYDELLDRGYRLPTERDWVLRENKWRAARHGLNTSMVVDSAGRTRPITNLIEEAVEELMPFARRLDCADELARVLEILETGTSSRRQRRIIDHGGDLRDVVDALRAEFATDTPFATAPGHLPPNAAGMTGR
jgi:carboxylate-amine ligase